MISGPTNWVKSVISVGCGIVATTEFSRGSGGGAVGRFPVIDGVQLFAEVFFLYWYPCISSTVGCLSFCTGAGAICFEWCVQEPIEYSEAECPVTFRSLIPCQWYQIVRQ